MDPLLVTFVGGETGWWSVERVIAVKGASVKAVAKVAILEGPNKLVRTPGTSWVLRGMTGPDRYTTADERKALATHPAALGRASATTAALIPIRKSADWWALPEKERRAIFEEGSHHIARSLAYLPRIARRLHHGRDLGEPFDFLTWFEFAPGDTGAFDELCAMLRSTEEWSYVEREVEIRLTHRTVNCPGFRGG